MLEVMRFRMTSALGVFLMLSAYADGSVSTDLDRRDERIRTYVSPKRMVWRSSSVKDADRLLLPKHGQVCERAFAQADGCTLVNGGGGAGFLLDFGRELHGSVQLGVSPGGKADARLRLRFGESVSEAMGDIGEKGATNDHALRDFELNVPSFGSIEVGNTGFRFLRIDLQTHGSVGLEFVRAISLVRPMREIGGFRSSDERLNKVFETAVRTVHLCCQDYLWDGIKRDRLVWMGDVYPEMRTILSVFGAVPILPETLAFAAATTAPDAWMQRMPCYTLWWIRNLAEWYRYTGDPAEVLRHGDYLRKTLDHVAAQVSASNTWDAEGFLDWPTKHNGMAVEAGKQALCVMAFEDASLLLDALGDASAAAVWKNRADKFRKVHCDPNGAKSAAALLALGGLERPQDMFARVLGTDGHRGVSTFYGYFMLEAMCAAGERQKALDTVRDYWGAMLDVGATSFWEDFNLSWTNNCYRIDELPVAGKKDVHGDYGEFCYSGFRHSLCHGWAGGPADWCIGHVLGIRPVDVGCHTVEVRPFLGDLDWAEGGMALPDGRVIRVRVTKGVDGRAVFSVNAPEGIVVRRE